MSEPAWEDSPVRPPTGCTSVCERTSPRPPRSGGRSQTPGLVVSAVLEVCQFFRDASVAEAWLIAQEPYLASRDYGHTVDSVEKLIKRHEAFEKSAASWEGRFAALEKPTTVSWQGVAQSSGQPWGSLQSRVLRRFWGTCGQCKRLTKWGEREGNRSGRKDGLLKARDKGS